MLPNKYGLINNSYLCYFNSLIQALTSSVNFNKNISEDKSKFIEPLKTIFLKYENIAGSYFPTLNMSNLSCDFVNKLRQSGNKNFGNGQEDVCEALHLLLEQMDKNCSIQSDFYSSLFQCRYAEIIICSCKKRRQVLEGDRYYKEDNIFIRITPDQFDKVDNHFPAAILTKQEEIQDLYCEFCKKNTKATKYSFLTRLSEIIIVCFDKFLMRKKINIPLNFTIEGIEKPMKYNMVAIIDHFGNMTGGHYISQTIRKDNNTQITLNDDSRILTISDFSINENNYLVFYEREN